MRYMNMTLHEAHALDEEIAGREVSPLFYASYSLLTPLLLLLACYFL